MATQSNVLLEGNLGHISLPNLVQLIAMEQKTASLTLSRVEIGQSAEMVFRRGELVCAQVNNIYGDYAMYRIIGWWNEGTFKLINLENDDEETLPERNVNSRMDYLLLEGMRQMDATQQYRGLVPHLTSAVSFTQTALDSFGWDRSEPPEWIPAFVRALPKSFSMAQMHQACEYDEIHLANLMSMLLGTQAVRIHSDQVNYDEEGYGFGQEKPKSTRYEAFAHLLMEYVGYEQAYGILDQTVYDMGWDDLDTVTFAQMLDLSDRLSHALSQSIDRKQVNDAMRRLRARATSLV